MAERAFRDMRKRRRPARSAEPASIGWVILSTPGADECRGKQSPHVPDRPRHLEKTSQRREAADEGIVEEFQGINTEDVKNMTNHHPISTGRGPRRLAVVPPELFAGARP